MMNSRRRIAMAFACLICLLSGCKDDSASTNLYIAAAANVQGAITELVDSFEVETGLTVSLIINSSGNITTQIEQGLPIDVFVSADMQYPTSLHRRGYGVEAPMMYCRGRLVIISRSQDIDPSFDAMTEEEIERIAIANPKVAPYGQKAMLALQSAGILESVEDKLVYGTNISQAHQFVYAGASDMGVTARSLINTERDHWAPIPDDLYNPLAQGMLLIERENGDLTAARRFYNYVQSDVAKRVLRSYGYLTDTKQ